MIASETTTSPFSVKLVLLTAAVGAGFAAPAQAAFISTAGPGYTPVTFSAGAIAPGYAIDLDRNGSTDYTIVERADGYSHGFYIEGSGTNKVDTFAGWANGHSGTSTFLSAGAIKASSSGIIANSNGSSLTASAPYVELVFQDAAKALLVGYIEVAAASSAGFTLTDFGYDRPANSVPEPGSLALLAAGAAGLGLLRRRRAARPV